MSSLWVYFLSLPHPPSFAMLLVENSWTLPYFFGPAHTHGQTTALLKLLSEPKIYLFKSNYPPLRFSNDFDTLFSDSWPLTLLRNPRTFDFLLGINLLTIAVFTSCLSYPDMFFSTFSGWLSRICLTTPTSRVPTLWSRAALTCISTYVFY